MSRFVLWPMAAGKSQEATRTFILGMAGETGFSNLKRLISSKVFNHF